MIRRFFVVGLLFVALALIGLGAAGGAAAAYLALQGARPVQAAFEWLGPRAAAAQTQPPQAEDGLLIAAVQPDSPAAAAGLRRGDILLEVNGKPVNTRADLVDQLQALGEGAEAVLTVRRGDEQVTLTARLAAREGRAILGITPCGEHEHFAIAAGGGLEGVRIQEVAPDSPAAAAGLKAGDVITAVDGEALGPERGLAEAIAEHAPGDRVILSVRRSGAEETEDVTVTLGENPEQAGAAYLGVRYSLFPRLGDDVPFLHEPGFALDIPEDLGISQGIVVGSVAEASPAAEAGLRSGDIVTAIDGIAVDGPAALHDAVAARKPGDTLTLKVYRGETKAEQEIAVTLGDKDGQAYLGVSGLGFFHIERFRNGEGGAEGWPELHFGPPPLELAPEGWPAFGNDA